MADVFDLSGRVAVVVGATSGIGKTLAEGLAEHGADVVASGRRALAYAVDVRDRKSVDRLRDAVLARFGRVDILVNAAGITLKKPTAAIGEDEWDSVLDTNVTGVLRTCQSFYEPLKASGRGRVVNIASLGSFLAFHEVAAYAASKAALLSLTKSLACEWARDGISVNAIAPGVFPTELNRALIMGTPRGEEMLMRTPMGRFGKPEELVGAAVLLASDGASFLTGQCIAVDGGYLASGVNARA
jgi:NAD(P)-dependent dehydrogenase (short-subunit alcohol dehydrogenase family)